MRNDQLISESVELFNRLSLQHLDREWVESIWDSEFTERSDLPLGYEEVLDGVDPVPLFVRLTEISHTIMKAGGSQEETEVSSEGLENSSSTTLGKKSYWSALIDQKVNNKALVALLFYFVDNGQNQSAGLQEWNLALASAGLYLALVGLPGSNAFKIFHPIMFSRTLDIFKLVSKLPLLQQHQQPAGRKRKKGTNSSSQSSRSSKRSRGSQQRSVSGSTQGSDEEEVDSDGEEGEAELSEREQTAILKSLLQVLDSLNLMLSYSSLRGQLESLERVVGLLVELTTIERSQLVRLSSEARYFGTADLAVRAFKGLEALCNEIHGELTFCSLIVFKGLFPGIILTPKDAGAITARGLNIIKGNALRFVQHIAEKGANFSESLLVLIQHCAARVPDKADYRNEAVGTVLQLLGCLDGPDFRSAVHWLLRYANSSRPAGRLVSIQLLGRLLTEGPTTADAPEAEVNGEDEEEEAMEGDEEREGEQRRRRHNSAEIRNILQVMNRFIFATICDKTNDIAPTVRTQALKALGEITGCRAQPVRALLEEVLSRKAENQKAGDKEWRELLEKDDDDDDDKEQAEEEQQGRRGHALSQINPLPLGADFIRELSGKALDLSVFVRKSALQVLENLLINSGTISGDLLKALCAHCRDPSMAVRKQMAISITDLVLGNPENRELVEAWVQAVFPLILDVETKIGEKVAECIWSCLGDCMVPSKKTSEPLHKLPWLVLLAVEKYQMESYLLQACSMWSKEGKLTKVLASSVQSYLGSEQDGPAWMLLSVFTAFVPCSEPQFVLHHFNSAVQNQEGVGLYTLLQILNVLKASVSKLSEEEQQLLQTKLLSLIREYKLPCDIIATAVDIVTAVSKAGNESVERLQSAIESWAVEIIVDIERILSESILEEHSDQEVEEGSTRSKEELSMRVITTLGELAMLAYRRMSSRLFLLLQSIAFFKDDDGAQVAVTQEPVFSQAVRCRFVPSARLRSLAVVSLGKMCLQQESQAKRIIPAFGQLLDTSPDPAMKNNVMFALSDMCVRYASLVDPLIPQMSTCLKDSSVVVRRATLIQLIRLLQEDYLKIRGKSQFFLRILFTLLDESEEIRQLAQFYIEQRLLKLLPRIMQSCFLEAIFHFNEYTTHARYNRFEVTERERRVFRLSGERNRKRRWRLYAFMLEHMDDEQRFRTTYYLANEILNGIVEGQLTLPEANAVLQDALTCLTSSEIKLSSLKEKEPGQAAEEEGEQQQGLEAMRKAVISHSVKKGNIELIIPIILALKPILEAAKSPLMEQLFDYLKKIMEDYPSEMKDILAADPTLAKEIEYDIRRHEEQRQEAELLRQEQEERERIRQAEEEERRQQQLAAAAAAPCSPATPRTPAACTSGPSTPRSQQSPARNQLLMQALKQRLVDKTFGSPANNSANKENLNTSSGIVAANRSLHHSVPPVSATPLENSADRLNRSQNSVPVEHLDKDPEGVVVLENVEKESNVPSSRRSAVALEKTVAAVEPFVRPADRPQLRERAKSTTSLVRSSKVAGSSRSGHQNRLQTHDDHAIADSPAVVAVDSPTAAADPPATAAVANAPAAAADTRTVISTTDVLSRAGQHTEPVEEAADGNVRNLSMGDNGGNGDISLGGRSRRSRSVGMRGHTGDKSQTAAELTPQAAGKKAKFPDGGKKKRTAAELDSSKRISGQGMPRQIQHKTPRSRRVFAIRAVSTPQVNKTMMAENVSFMSEAALELSAITVLSPSSSREPSLAQQDNDVSSFRFQNGGRRDDPFDNLLHESAERRKSGPDSGSAAAVRKKRSSRPNLANILEDDDEAH